IAFGEHYAKNVAAADDLHRGDANLYWEEIVARDFGGSQSLGSALGANPRALLWHVGVNARALPGAFPATATPALDLPRRRVFYPLCVGLAAAALLGGVGVWRRLARGTDDPGRRGLLIALGMFALLLVPTSAAVLLICPRLHYLVPLVTFTIALAGASLGAVPRWGTALTRLESGPVLLALAVVLLALTPNRAPGPHLQEVPRWRQPLHPER